MLRTLDIVESYICIYSARNVDGALVVVAAIREVYVTAFANGRPVHVNDNLLNLVGVS